MGKRIDVDFGQTPRSIEMLLAEVMTEAQRRWVERTTSISLKPTRKRSGALSPEDDEGFAQAINLIHPRNPGLTGANIRAYRRRHAVPRTDIYFRALILAGFDSIGALSRFRSRRRGGSWL